MTKFFLHNQLRNRYFVITQLILTTLLVTLELPPTDWEGVWDPVATMVGFLLNCNQRQR